MLPLNPQLLEKSVTERRAEAGKDIKLGKGAVTPGTIRDHYEPRALDSLARVLWAMEQEFQAEDIQGTLAKVGMQGIFDNYNVGDNGGCLLRQEPRD